MKIPLDRRVEGLQAPSAAYDDPPDRHQGIVGIHLIGQLEGGDKSSLTQLGKGLRVPQSEGEGEIMERGAGDGFQLLCRLVDLDIPVITLVFFYVVMIPGMAADD